MSIVNEHVFYQEFGLNEGDIISLRELYQSGIDIKMPDIPSLMHRIELEIIFKNNTGDSLTLFDRIISVKYESIVSGELARRFIFLDVTDYFAFMSNLNKVLLLGFYALCHENAYGIAPDGHQTELGVPVPHNPVNGPCLDTMVEGFPTDTHEEKADRLVGEVIKKVNPLMAGDVVFIKPERADYDSPEDFKKFLDNNNISVRSGNILYDAEIDTITKFIDYYQRNLCFKELRNCGKKSDEELTELVRVFIDDAEPKIFIDAEGNIFISENAGEPRFIRPDWVNRDSTEYFENFLKRNWISERSVTILNGESINTISKFIDYYQINLGYRGLRNCGMKSDEELKEFAEFIIQSEADIITPELGPIKEDYKRLRMYLIKTEQGFVKAIKDSNLIEHFIRREINLFRFIDSFLRVIFDEREYFINSSRYTGIFEYKMPYNLIADRFEITDERARQLYEAGRIRTKRTLSAFFENNPFIKEYFHREYFQNEDLLLVEEDFFETIRNEEEVNFNNGFIAEILEMLYIERFDFARIDGENLILINKKYKFDIAGFVHEIINYLKDKRDRDVFIHLESMLGEYSSNNDPELINDQKRICNTILNDCFDIFPVNGEFILNKTTSKYLPEFAFEILEERDQPMHIDEILYELNNRYTGVNIVEGTVRRYLYQNPSIVCLGRSSTFGLRRWEDDPEREFKGGTIVDIVYQLLLDSERTMHIADITAYVIRYRNTIAYNILNNLILDKRRRFRYLGNGVFELNQPEYIEGA